MIKYHLSFVLIFFIYKSTFCQTLNQDAEGKSSIVVPGGTLNFDIKEGLVKANYYSKYSRKPQGWTYGIDLQGQNSEGTAGLFEGGNFSPDVEASVLLGRYQSWQDNKDQRTSRILGYVRLGLTASEFKYDKGNTFISINTRFVDTLHISPKIELGSTLRIGGRWYLGLLVGNKYQNNQLSLRKTVYKYTVNDQNIPGLQSSRDITAYVGNYGKYSNIYINFDALYFISTEDTSNYVCPNLYFRYNISNKKNLRENNAVGGLSVNFISIKSGKFLGGVYVQTNDLFKEQSQYFNETIQFGLVARISFSSISLTN